jgi:hypothetical protein
MIKNLNLHIDTNLETDQKVLGELLHAQKKSRKTEPAFASPNIRRQIMKNRIVKLTAVAVFILGVCIGISYIVKNHHGSVAFGEVFEAMRQTKTVTWTESAEVSPPDNENTIQISSGHITRCAYKAPSHKRREVTQMLIHPKTKHIYEHKHVEIIDRNAGKELVLNPQEMTAAIYSFEPVSGEDPLFDVFLNPKQNMPSDTESLGNKKIGDRETVGFRIQKMRDGTYFWAGEATDIWVDAKTKRIVLVETTGAKGRVTYMLKDFVFDEELDDSLFSLELPEGYKQIPPPPIFSISPE